MLGVLGGKDTPLETVRLWATGADLVVAADSGADACLAVGIRPVVVGDMDSFEGSRAGLEIVEDGDQYTTDCDKLLAYVASRGFRSVAIVCLEGDRIDHVLSSLASLGRTSLEVSLVSRRGVGRVMRAGSSLALDVAAGTLLSVSGLGPCVASLEGVKWPFSSLDLTPPLPQSISNRAEGRSVLTVQSGVALLTVEIEAAPWEFPWGNHS